MKIYRNGNVITVQFTVDAAWEQWLLLRSDAHHDSLHCNRDLERRQLQKAIERNALILDLGDLFDAMQGKFDPRRDYRDLRSEYLKMKNGVVAYYDNIVDDLFEFYKPYAKNWLLFARGNHETAVIKNAQIDLTGNLVHRLNAEAGGSALVGNYGGWIRFLFVREKNQGSWRLKYFHGSGGDAPVTRGVIQTARQAVYLPDADIVVNGHSHNDYVLNIKRERLSNKGELYFDTVTFVRTPGYNNAYQDGSAGWEVERGGVPKPQGSAWIRLSWDSSRHRPTREIYLDTE